MNVPLASPLHPTLSFIASLLLYRPLHPEALIFPSGTYYLFRDYHNMLYVTVALDGAATQQPLIE